MLASPLLPPPLASARIRRPPAAHKGWAQAGGLRAYRPRITTGAYPACLHDDAPSQQLAELWQRDDTHARQRRRRLPLLWRVVAPVGQVKLPPAGIQAWRHWGKRGAALVTYAPKARMSVCTALPAG